MAKQIIITQNNSGIGIINTILDASKAPIDITNYDCTVDVVYPDGNIVNYPLEKSDAVNGKVLFVLGAEETAQEGLYKLYFNVSDINSLITAQNMVTYYVMAEKGGA